MAKPTNVSIKKNQIKVLFRLLGYMFKNYKFRMTAVIVFIFLSSFFMVVGTMFTKQLMDGFIVPNINKPHVDFAPLAAIIGKMITVYVFSIISTYLYGIFMVIIAQGTLKKLRDEVFEHMESLPIKFFDTNAHGDIMSVYSSDIDT